MTKEISQSAIHHSGLLLAYRILHSIPIGSLPTVDWFSLCVLCIFLRDGTGHELQKEYFEFGGEGIWVGAVHLDDDLNILLFSDVRYTPIDLGAVLVDVAEEISPVEEVLLGVNGELL